MDFTTVFDSEFNFGFSPEEVNSTYGGLNDGNLPMNMETPTCSSHDMDMEQLSQPCQNTSGDDLKQTPILVRQSCTVCEKTFSCKRSLIRHTMMHDLSQRKFICDVCNRQFVRQDNLKRHLKSHTNPRYSCKKCDEKFNTQQNLRQHVETQHSNMPLISNERKSTTILSPKKPRKITEVIDTIKTIFFEPEEKYKYDICEFFTSIHNELCQYIETELEKNSIKWYLMLKVILVKSSPNDQITAFFNTNYIMQLTVDSVENYLKECYDKINTSFENFMQRESGWTFKEMDLELKISKYAPL